MIKMISYMRSYIEITVFLIRSKMSLLVRLKEFTFSCFYRKLKLKPDVATYLERAVLTDDWRSIRLDPWRRGRRILPAARARRDARRFNGCSENEKQINLKQNTIWCNEVLFLYKNYSETGVSRPQGSSNALHIRLE
jgi:hypothetical protein